MNKLLLLALLGVCTLAVYAEEISQVDSLAEDKALISEIEEKRAVFQGGKCYRKCAKWCVRKFGSFKRRNICKQKCAGNKKYRLKRCRPTKRSGCKCCKRCRNWCTRKYRRGSKSRSRCRTLCRKSSKYRLKKCRLTKRKSGNKKTSRQTRKKTSRQTRKKTSRKKTSRKKIRKMSCKQVRSRCRKKCRKTKGCKKCCRKRCPKCRSGKRSKNKRITYKQCRRQRSRCLKRCKKVKGCKKCCRKRCRKSYRCKKGSKAGKKPVTRVGGGCYVVRVKKCVCGTKYVSSCGGNYMTSATTAVGKRACYMKKVPDCATKRKCKWEDRQKCHSSSFEEIKFEEEDFTTQVEVEDAGNDQESLENEEEAEFQEVKESGPESQPDSSTESEPESMASSEASNSE